MAARATVDQALSRLAKTGKLRRLARGLYDFPKVHPKLGPLSPAPDDVAQALARETGSQVQIAGARAANALGLSTPVPANSSYLTDGPSRRVVLGKRVVDLRHASPKHLIAPGSAAGTVVQALRHVGPLRAADVAQIAARRLSASDKKTLASTAVQAPAWMLPTLVSIANAVSGDLDRRRVPLKGDFRSTSAPDQISGACRNMPVCYDLDRSRGHVIFRYRQHGPPLAVRLFDPKIGSSRPWPELSF